MCLRFSLIVLLDVIASMVLVGCSANGPVVPPQAPVSEIALQPDLHALYLDLAAAGGSVFRLDPETSVIRIYVFRGGRAPWFGHNHVLSAPRFTGYVYLPRAGSTDARFDLEFRLDELELDRPEVRLPMGEAFATELTSSDIERTRAHMLGDENLQAQRYPFVRVHSLQIVGEAPKFATRVRFELHGQQREMWLPLHVEGMPKQLLVSGSLVLRQTDFGIQPYSALGGSLAVQDEVLVEFRLSGTQIQRAP